MNRRPCLCLAANLVIAMLWLMPTLVTAEEEWYRVEMGDTIQSIAAQFGVTAEAIMQHNGLAAASPIARPDPARAAARGAASNSTD